MASEEVPEDDESFAGRLRVLELYSGIGGMHWALKESGVDYDVVQAIDVNTTANAIYQHNFPQVSICASSIAKLTLEQLGKWSPNTLLMSPPCQPFTRVGKKQDCQDPRTQSFLHLMDLLRKLEHKPEYILVENVKGFEVSETRSLMLDMLHDCKYAFQEFLLTPLQFGVPNCRMRYYLIAKLKPLEFAFWTSDKILDTVPMEALQWLRYRQCQDAADSDSLIMPPAEPSHNPRCKLCQAQRATAKIPTSPSVQEMKINPDHEHQQTASGSFQQSYQLTYRTCEGQCTEASNCQSCCRDRSQGDGGHVQGSRTQICIRCGKRLSSNIEEREDVLSGHILSGSNPSGLVQSGDVLSGNFSSGNVSPENIPRRNVPSRDISTLTLAEAGRNMRHCEEEDTLVCRDGTHLGAFLEEGDDKNFQPYLVPDKDLRMFIIMDVVHPSFKKSSCFTKRYGHYVEGAGSLVMMTDDVQVVKEASDLKSWAVEQKNRQQWGEEELSTLRRLKLRYFTPREVANLLCFPPEFEFPSEGFSPIQCYRVLGNSLNVHVVSILIRLMLMEPGVI